MHWKQPIQTDIPEVLGDKVQQSYFQLLLIRCRNEDGVVYVDDTPISLKRGQCIFGRYEFGLSIGMKRNECMRVERVIEKLEKTSKLISKQKSKNCSIITVLNYDQWVGFEQSNEQSVSNQRANAEQSVSTNKSEKIVPIPLNEDNRKYALSIGLTTGDIQAFEDYFTGKKPWQKEKAFEVKARLRTWMRNIASGIMKHSVEISPPKYEWADSIGKRFDQVEQEPDRKSEYKRLFPKEYTHFYE